jgi:xyloglucan-specific endo-beta-1,4-glucanase
MWHWTYSSASSDLIANVAFDLWLSNIPNTYGASSSTTLEVYVTQLI